MVFSNFVMLMEGVEKLEQSTEYREWFRMNVHMILEHVISPLKPAMTDGIYLPCSDGETRLCVPILTQYPADYEEQSTLGNFMRGACPKCIGPRGHLEEFRVPFLNDMEVDMSSDWTNGPPARTDEHARHYRDLFRRGEISLEELQGPLMSYHPSDTFSLKYPFGGILDSLCPDLLHQVSKCFWDYVMEQFLNPLMVKYWKHKAKKNKKAVLREIDKRFRYTPGFQNLRRFSHGVNSEDHHWTMREYKDVARIAPGVLSGLCPRDGMDLLREYLHILRLSHYSVHTDETLDLLNSAIHSFWRILKNPRGLFKKWEIWTHEDDYAPVKLHYFSHYAAYVKEKGCLPGCSTDRTEPLHKELKVYYRQSNKGPDKELFLLRSEAKLRAFEDMIFSLEGSIPWDSPSHRDSKSPPEQDNQVVISSTAPPVSMRSDEVQKELSVSAIWGSKWRKGWPLTIRDTMSKLECPGFSTDLHSFIKTSPILAETLDRLSIDQLEEFQIGAANLVKFRYPVNLIYGVDFGGSFGNEWNTRYRVDIVRSNQYVGRDFVLVKSERDPRSRTTTTMSSRKVARVLFFFKFKHRNRRQTADLKQDPTGYAYVQWFSTVGPADATTGMYTVKRTNKFEVIEINRIECAVHLIPKFGNTFRASELKVSVTKWGPEVHQHFDEFWLNHWVDIHYYNMIF